MLFTLLGLYAFSQRKWKVNTDSQSDDGEPSVDHENDDSSPEDTVAPQLSQLQDEEIIIMDINSCPYEIGFELGEGGFRTVYEATRLEDNLQVAVKFASKELATYVSVDRYSAPVPLEVALHVRANESRAPQIVQLLDWQEEADHYIIVLERPMPSQSLDEFLGSYTGTMGGEDLARVIMWQVTLAAQVCCRKGVFHRDIKPENLLINPDTLKIKLIDFGCGEMLTYAGYTSFSGTDEYCPPEYWTNKRYHGEPATVWSLGITLFVIMSGGYFPSKQDHDKFDQNTWICNELSQECCDFLCSCLQNNPAKRTELEEVSLHDWFKSNEAPHASYAETSYTAVEPIALDPEVNDEWSEDHDHEDSSDDDDVFYSCPEDTVAPQLSQLQELWTRMKSAFNSVKEALELFSNSFGR